MADMTTAAHHRRRERSHAARPPEPAPAKPDWEKYGLLVMVALQTAGAIWFFATEASRIATLEAVTKPIAEGQLSRIDQRTEDTSRDVAALKAWLVPPSRQSAAQP